MMNIKILVVNTVGLSYDGISRIMVSYLQAMDLSEMDIYVAATVNADPNIIKKIDQLGCHIVELPSRRKKPFKYFWKLACFIKKNGIYAIHAHGNSGTLAIEMLAGWLGGCKKRIAHSHSTSCNQVKADKLLRPVFNLLYTDALACGEFAGKWLFKNRPFKILQNGRDVNEFVFDENIRTKVRNEYSIRDELVIGHVGGFFKPKNHKFLLAIYREILKKEPTARLFMIGDGPLKKEIEFLAMDIKQNIVFTGMVDRVADYLQAMDGMLLPSLFEGVPLVAVEWQINGLPCVLSDTITKECVFTNSVSFMSLDEQAEEWANRIIGMAKGNMRKKSSSIAAQNAVKAGFDIRSSAHVLKTIYTG